MVAKGSRQRLLPACAVKRLVLVAMVALAVACHEASLIQARPQLSPFGGLPRLRAASTEFVTHDGAYHDEFHFAHGDDHVHLSYHARHNADAVIVHLDEELALEQITCRADDLAMLLTFNSTFSARQFYDKVTNEPAKDVLLSGGIEWGCPDPKTGAPTAILRRLEKASLEGASVLALTSPASHQDFFSELKLSFRTTRLPPPVIVDHTSTTNEPDEPEGLRHKRISAVDKFFGDVWNRVKTIGKEIATVVKGVVKAVKFLATGKYDYDGKFEGLYQKWEPKTRVQLDPAKECDQCWGQFDTDVHFDLHLADYKIHGLELVANTQLELSMGANSVYAAVSKSGSIPIITLYWPPITFTVGVVPFVITLAMPIAEEWKVEFTTTASLSARTNAKGNVEYGVTYKDGDLVPVNKHSYSRDGQFEKIEISSQAAATVGLQLVMVVTVDFIGDISFGLEPFLEMVVKNDPSSACHGVQAALNLGATGTIGFGIGIGDIIRKDWGPYAIASFKGPLSSGCVSQKPPLESDVAMPLTMEPAVPIKSGPLLVGNTWAGWQEPVVHCNADAIYIYANITFQFVSEVDGKLFFVVSFNDIMPDGTWCVQQGMYDVNADDSGMVTLRPSGSDAPFDVSYHKCQLPKWDSLVYLVPIYGTISGNNWDRIDMHSADSCLTLTMLRTPGA